MIQSKKRTLRLSLVLMAVLCVSIIASLFFKEQWLWLDEVLSYVLISDPSIAHMNDAVVSGMDANPPLFANLYWLIGHGISLNPLFLRAVSVVIFAGTLALFYRFTTILIGSPGTNFVLITGIAALTYLNLTLATQIRTYAIFLLIGFGYFVVLQRLIQHPGRAGLLLAHVALGILLVYAHNFGLFYVAASGAFFALLLVWSGERPYWLVLAAHGLVGVCWGLTWYPNFAIQTDAGRPHSWIPLPTALTFFSTVGELAPALSAKLESRPLFVFLPVLRFVLVIGLFAYIALPRLRAGFRAVRTDKAFMFYLLSGWLYAAIIGMALVVSLGHTSVWISRYQWPSHLLLIYQLVYAWYALRDRLPLWLPTVGRAGWVLPLYVAGLAGFLFYQNRKVVVFPAGIMQYLPKLNPDYPVFVESADYFMPIWFHAKKTKIRYLLDWKTAMLAGNMLNATVEHKILKSVRDKYRVAGILTAEEFNPATIPHFYVIDEKSQFQMEQFIRQGRIHVVRQLPIALSGHRLLECTF